MSSLLPSLSSRPPSSLALLRPLSLAGLCALAVGVAGCGSDKSTLTAVGLPAGVAVLVTDYTSSAVSLLDASTLSLAQDACLSGASFASTQIPLSGDVALASSASPTHELVVIDRKNSVLTFASATSCTVRAQLSVGTGGFKANPHDVLVLSEHKAYVTRYETNHAPDPAMNGLDGGDDILVIDPSVPAVTGRIPLAAYATMGAQGATQARPGRILRTTDHVLVALDSSDAMFSDQGPGRLVAIDPETDQVTGQLDIPSFKNCGALDEDPTSKRVIVSCGGSYSAANQLDESGFAIFDLGSEPAAVTTMPASTFGTQPLSFASVSLSGANTAFVAALGSLDFTTNAVLANDVFLRVDLTAGTATQLATSTPYGFGGHLLAAGKVLLADGDATAPRLHVLSPEAAAGQETSLDPDPAHHLPPRELVFF